MSVVLLPWQQHLMKCLTDADEVISYWYIAPQHADFGKTWMAHYLGDTCGALNTYPFADTMPLTHTIQAVKHYLHNSCTQAPTQKILVFDMHTGCRLRHRLKRLGPCLSAAHVLVFTDEAPDKDTLALRDWEIVDFTL